MKKLLIKIDRAYMAFLNWATSTKGACWLISIFIWAGVYLDPPKTLKDWLLIAVTVYYQGVALSAIGSQQKIEGDLTRKLQQETHDAAMNQLATLNETHDAELQEITMLKEMNANVMEELELAREDRQELTDLVKYLHEKLESGGMNNGK